jgi:hypothetical protein
MGLTVSRGQFEMASMRMVLNIGAVICALLGAWVIYVGIVNFGGLSNPASNYLMLLFEIFYVSLSFTPGFMLVRGFKTKRWQRVVIGLVEAVAIVLAVAAFLLSVALAAYSRP